MEVRAGDVLGAKYRLDSVLGEGGMGVVWRATHLETESAVAVKLVKSSELEARRRFAREARLAAAMKHPHVVGVLEVLELDDGTSAMVMELLEGETLAAKLEREKRLGPGETAKLLLPVVSAIGEAHARGIVHRDLKPENIFLAQGGGVKVLDFGIAKFIANQGDTGPLTATGATIGTPYYMAPEQVFAERDLDHRADIWALGIVLYQCLSGVLPTRAENGGQVLKLILSGQLKPLAGTSPDVPRALASLVDSMLRPRATRLSNLALVRDGLAAFSEFTSPDFGASTVPLAAMADGSEPHVIRVQSSPQSLSAPFAKTEVANLRSPSPMRRLRWAGVAAASIAALAGGGWFATRRHDLAVPLVKAETPTHTLTDDDGILACPALEASGVEAPTGWLGAAAADLSCRRAMYRMGGRVERVLYPAHLLDLPRQPTKDFPVDPFDASDARARSVDVAKRRAQAYLDGSVKLEGGKFALSLLVRDASGVELSRVTSEAPTLGDAAAQAVDALASQGALPNKKRLDADQAPWVGMKTVDAAWLVEAANWRDMPPVCQEWVERKDELYWPNGILSCPGIDAIQAKTPVALDASSPAALTFAAGYVARRGTDAEAQRALELLSHTSDPVSAVALYAHGLVMGNLEDRLQRRDRAEEHWLRASSAFPSDVMAWELLMAGPHPDPELRAAWTAWNPGFAVAWYETGELSSSPADKARSLRRAVVLQGDMDYRVPLARALLDAGNVVEVRALAGSLGDTEDNRLSRAYLLARLDAREAKLSAAFDRLKSAIVDGDNLLLQARASAIYQLVLLGRMLGRRAEWADESVKHFVLREGHASTALQSGWEWSAVLLCLEASPDVARPCVEALKQAGAKGEVAWAFGSRALLDGTRRYAAGEMGKAVATWRAGLPDMSDLARFLPIVVFDEAGDHALAERLDALAASDAFYGGISEALPRMARRAFAAGDKAKARELAQKVVDAWATADVRLPIVDEMRKLLDKGK